jgi:hypothetical protein
LFSFFSFLLSVRKKSLSLSFTSGRCAYWSMTFWNNGGGASLANSSMTAQNQHLVSMGRAPLGEADSAFALAIGFQSAAGNPPPTRAAAAPTGRVFEHREDKCVVTTACGSPRVEAASRKSNMFENIAQVSPRTQQRMAAIPLSVQFGLDMENMLQPGGCGRGHDADANGKNTANGQKETVDAADAADAVAYTRLQAFRSHRPLRH